MNYDDTFCATLVLANFSDGLNAMVVANAVTTLVQELNDNPEELDEFDVTRALSRILHHRQHVGAVLAGDVVAALTRVQQNGSERVANEATFALEGGYYIY